MECVAAAMAMQVQVDCIRLHFGPIACMDARQRDMRLVLAQLCSSCKCCMLLVCLNKTQ